MATLNSCGKTGQGQVSTCSLTWFWATNNEEAVLEFSHWNLKSFFSKKNKNKNRFRELVWGLRPALSAKNPVISRCCCISASLPSPFALQPSLKKQSHAAGLNYKRSVNKCHECAAEVRDQCHPPSDSFYMSTDFFRLLLLLVMWMYVHLCTSVQVLVLAGSIGFPRGRRRLPRVQLGRWEQN